MAKAKSILGLIDEMGLAKTMDLSAVPDVPQYPLVRYEPLRGRPSSLDQLLTPETATRMTEYAKRGEQAGGRQWYNTEPLRQSFVEELGPEVGQQRYGRFMDIVAATSPRSKVDQNIRRASYLYGEDVSGRPIAGLTNKDFPPGYGHLAHETQNYLLQDLADGRSFQAMNRPKTSSFAENLKGNQTPMTIDTHNFAAITGNIKNKKSPADTQYRYLEDFQAELADKLNMTPAQWQASVWMGADTGVADARPFLEVFDDVVSRTAERDKKPKAQVVRDFITGKAPLYQLAGGTVLGAGSLVAPEDAQASMPAMDFQPESDIPVDYRNIRRQAADNRTRRILGEPEMPAAVQRMRNQGGIGVAPAARGFEAPDSPTMAAIADRMGDYNQWAQNAGVLGMMLPEAPAEYVRKMAYQDRQGLLDYIAAAAGML